MLHANSTLKREVIILTGNDREGLDKVSELIRAEGFENVSVTHDAAEAVRSSASLILIASKEESEREKLLTYFIESLENTPVIVLTHSADTDTVIRFIRAGAFDLITAPYDKLAVSVIHALERKILLDALTFARGTDTLSLKNPDAFAEIVTGDLRMKKIFNYMEQIAPSNYPVLITGETGVGKELFAKAIHKLSGRKTFISVNIAGVDDTVFSDTLFGHKKGAFTGADTEREGLLARASGGLLFLDEIGDLPEISQVKLLRFLQESSYYKLGSDVQLEVNAKIILATNKALEEEIRQGRFRSDLYYRIRIHHLEIPPLRERKGDLALLVPHFAAATARQLNKKVPEIKPELISFLEKYSWPGNIRELEALVSDAVVRNKRGPLTPSAFNNLAQAPYSVGFAEEKDTSPFPTLKECEEQHIMKALALAGGNQKIAASLLGISRQALNKRLLNKRSD